MPDRTFAPQRTSRRQVAAGHRIAVERSLFTPGMFVVDYGGGKYDDGVDYLAQHGITAVVYDPYARTDAHNLSVLEYVTMHDGADGVALNNVLNVIPDPDIRRDVIRLAYGMLTVGAPLIVTIYEGNRSGIGSAIEYKHEWTWQENRPIADYYGEIRAAVPSTASITKVPNAYIVYRDI